MGIAALTFAGAGPANILNVAFFVTSVLIRLTALKIAFPFEEDVPVLVRVESSCTVQRKPVGLAVCTT